MTQAVTRPGETGIADLREVLDKAKGKLAEVAPKHMKVERITRLLLSAVSRNPALLHCTRESVLQFCMKCSETGLEPIGPGGAWPVPFRNKNGNTEMQFIPDYRGLINIAKRAKAIKDAYAEVVREGDAFEYELGLTPALRHKPATRERGATIGAYCVVVLPDDARRFTYMDRDEIEAIRKISKAATTGPWKDFEGEMYKKTVVRRAMKLYAGVSRELDAAVEADNDATGIDMTIREPVQMPRIVQDAPEPTAPTSAPPEPPIATPAGQQTPPPADAGEPPPDEDQRREAEEAENYRAQLVARIVKFQRYHKVTFKRALQDLNVAEDKWMGVDLGVLEQISKRCVES